MHKVYIVATSHEGKKAAQEEIRKLDSSARFENLADPHPVFWTRTLLSGKDLESIGQIVQVYDSVRRPDKFPGAGFST